MRRSAVVACVVLVVLGGSAVVCAAEVISLPSATTGLDLEASGAEIVRVRVSEVRLEAIEIDGASWAVVRVPGAANLMERGLPSLPYLTTEYLLGRTDGIDLELEAVTVREIDLDALGFAGVAPSKGHFDRGTDPATVPWVFDAKVYGGDRRFPSSDVRVARPFIAGPVRGQVLHLAAAFWRPDTNTLGVVEEAAFRVVHLPEADNPRLGPNRPLSGLFDGAARLNAVNYDSVGGRYTPFVEAGRLLILAADDFIDEVQPLADWEALVGYPTLLVPVSAAGATAAEIKSFIQSLYDAPEGLTWIILVGDIQQIPALTGVREGATCDPCYTKLEGADNRPDAAISRISAQTGEQVALQVAKILEHEQYPDTGSAGAWISKAFGIAGDDTGGSPSYADWERMEFLRTDLVEPAYHFTEFDQLYHSPSKAAVAASVNAGRSLGLYIGHGSETSWVTSGFSVSDVNSMLTNAETLPVIWSVACVNGRFDRSGGDCFAEAWLKKAGGGAVSFEGATTNESWVPPCDAQRGFIDSLRLETAFTTGGQHVNGKLYCMDLNGDSNSSEGTRFMEQSTLFGAATMWTRTLPAVAPDEPDDFVSAGGVATLTVTVGGAPLTKAGGAIVSFYTDSGGINVVGSGLIDANGVVTAAVSGDPSHCHIHGQNLIPTSFELAARPAGRVSLDGAAYACADTVTVRVADSNVPGSSPVTVDTTTVELSAGGGGSHVVTLTELAPDRSVYAGSAVLGTDLVVGHGDVLTATYIDVDDGAGGVNVPRTASAFVDCAGPVVSNVQVTAGLGSLTLSFDTDEPGTTEVYHGTAVPPASVVSSPDLEMSHSVTIDGTDPCTTYFFEIHTADALGNLTADTGGGSYYGYTTGGEAGAVVDATDTPVAIPDNNPTGASSHITVDAAFPILDVDVLVNITHTYTGDLELQLIGPDGTTVVLSDRHGGSGDDYTGTVFDDEAPTAIANGSAPFTGSFQPDQPLAALDGLPAAGVWTFKVVDSYGYDTGSIEGWQLRLTLDAPCGGLFADDFEGGSCALWSLAVGEQ